eukprot:6457702-Alexandrium_andersonii.AAC.1
MGRARHWPSAQWRPRGRLRCSGLAARSAQEPRPSQGSMTAASTPRPPDAGRCNLPSHQPSWGWQSRPS